MSELLPCPFCGGGAWITRDVPTGHFHAACPSCHATGRKAATKEFAATIWNRRPTNDHGRSHRMSQAMSTIRSAEWWATDMESCHPYGPEYLTWVAAIQRDAHAAGYAAGIEAASLGSWPGS